VPRANPEKSLVKNAVFWILGLPAVLSGCATPLPITIPPITSVTPSPTGIPNSVTSFAGFEFVSVQGTGQIFTYKLSSGSQVLAGSPYATPCADPSGMVITTISNRTVMAVVCYDTASLLTLTVNPDGSLAPLGSLSGLPMPYPGIVLAGTDVLVPLLGAGTTNGAIAKVSIASPATPVLLATTTLASPSSGGISNAGYLAVSGGYIFTTAGSEADPLNTSSTIQVLNEATMTLVGTPLVVPHSPQQLTIQGTVLYATIFDAAQLESIDISNPASLQPLQTFSLTTSSQTCHPIPVVARDATAYLGCYAEGTVQLLDVSNPSQIRHASTFPDISNPQRFAFSGNMLLATSGAKGGSVYQIDLATP